MAGARRTKTDWDAVERDYRPGVLSDREIARRHGISHTALGKHAREHGWQRDLQGKIKARASDKVARIASRIVRGATITAEDVRGSPAIEQDDAQIVEDNATLQAAAILGMRADIQRASRLCQMLFVELETVSGHQVDIHGLCEALLTAPSLDMSIEERAHLVGEIAKLTSLPSRVASMQKLSGALMRLVALQRQSLGITDSSGAGGEAPFETLLLTVLEETEET